MSETKNKINFITEIIGPLYKRLEKCDICPRNCHANRLEGQKGYCQTNKDLIVYSAFLHQGEEPGISCAEGSGTVFFSGCNLKCVYCQNYKFSHTSDGKAVSEAELAQIMLKLQAKGAANINLVTPTHFLPQILKALLTALEAGLNIPIVYNTSGYEKKEVIEKLNGIVDIYLTDIKYITPETAKNYSQAPDYPKSCLESVKAMASQIKDDVSSRGALKKGLVIRHLVLPEHTKESKEILSWIKKNAPQALISVMFQYQPYHKAGEFPQINRPVNQSEHAEIKSFVEKEGLAGWVQDFNPEESLAGPYFEPNIL